MGRFGNQAAHFLGGLAMAKALNRTLVLPPWNDGQLMPFDRWFNVERLAEYHRVITAADFMENLAPAHWPPAARIGMCFHFPSSDKPCVMDETDHNFWFWKGQGIKFVRTEPYMLPYDPTQGNVKDEWDRRFPVSEYPVLALRGAPSPFPMHESCNRLHQYLQWSDDIAAERDSVIQSKLSRGKFVGVHVRNAMDWESACKHIDQSSGASFMAAPQCVGYSAGVGTVTKEMCLPTSTLIAEETAKAVKRIGASSVYVATPNNPMLKEIQAAVGADVEVLHLGLRPVLDLAILARSDHFIGNCVSSFSAFVRQERDANGLTSSFFGHGRSYLSPRIHEDL